MATTDPHVTSLPQSDATTAPNLATLDQLRTRGRNALLSPRHSRRAKPAGCTTC